MKTAAGLHHNNLVALHGAGKQGETCWFAMEYVEGEPLIKVIERLGTKKMISWKYVLSLGVQVAGALEALHEKHIIHRNVAPESILIRAKDKVPKLGDMMLARVVNGAEVKTTARPGELTGNVPYMAPERTRGDAEVDIRSDIYSLGATLYTLLDRQAPVRGEDPGRDRRQDPTGRPDPSQAIPGRDPRRVSRRRGEDAGQAPGAALPDTRGGRAGAGSGGEGPGPSPDPGKSAFIRLPSNPGPPAR